MHIPIGQKGRIIEGEDVGCYVKVIDDAEATGGFLILTSKSADMSSVHDSWVIDKEALAQYFDESGWVIEWLSTSTGH
ncbi:hypothetical protein [Polaromonas sp. JS666]|uniref:hypothetical protein n=1 Tax=Polaromonas sp. (strain JS666 / ATCC BAA-500) TaxID=296591 RepID=UPI0009448AA4|nr:hypothetical protein [Polaromonas sp. JS666]